MSRSLSPANRELYDQDLQEFSVFLHVSSHLSWCDYPDHSEEMYRIAFTAHKKILNKKNNRVDFVMREFTPKYFVV